MNRARYSSVAVALHWAIATMILGQIAAGLFMHELPNTSPLKFPIYQIHKSVGLSILALTVLRLGWRLTHKVPELPAAMPGWQKIAARATHWGFYALLILTPLAGWAIVSVSPKDIPTIWFGVVEIPHLPISEGIENRRAAEEVIADRHEFLAFTILFLLALHVGAALKHALFDRDGVLRSMAPATSTAWIGVVAILVALGAGAAYSWGASATQSSAIARTDAPAPSHKAGDANRVAAISEDTRAESPPDAASEDESVTPPKKQRVLEKPEPAAAPASRSDRPNWLVDAMASSLRFIGEEGDRRFEGEFADFTAFIRFDENALDRSWVSVEVRMASGATGDQLRDATLPGEEWFDVGEHPTARFISNDIRHIGGNTYEAAGELTVKEFTRPVTLSFTLTIDGAEATALGGADLVRTDFGLGTDATWLEEEGVALDVRVEFQINATRAD